MLLDGSSDLSPGLVHTPSVEWQFPALPEQSPCMLNYILMYLLAPQPIPSLKSDVDDFAFLDSFGDAQWPELASTGSVFFMLALLLLFSLFVFVVKGEVSNLRAKLQAEDKEKEDRLIHLERAMIEIEDLVRSRFYVFSPSSRVRVTLFGTREDIQMNRMDPKIGKARYEKTERDSDVVILPLPKVSEVKGAMSASRKLIDYELVGHKRHHETPGVGMCRGSVIVDYDRFPGIAHRNGGWSRSCQRGTAF
uniref:Uncharacterized protein n=1 Tax=Chromera velia CCMP2878 TaxID=1169474 RepID=A0A0G4FN37_9ALVE|eukprot:Cvel_17887.t1-p1 / transcript=Cvel_17887.t1 / gene=Cvel_17887 / organism=Chromera_velia_CCMP2878 / gene_product=hypothetical protein / transcript_product=hypothetical protein / location=Cvel_scaffold1451:32668-37878(-) / protein_length=249 / sequence_SO=supercontig / SO=protein_coding / is_pseudo=false